MARRITSDLGAKLVRGGRHYRPRGFTAFLSNKMFIEEMEMFFLHIDFHMDAPAEISGVEFAVYI
jgi:hypothetical protein